MVLKEDLTLKGGIFMNFDKLTNKSREAISEARGIAVNAAASSITDAHLLIALLSDKEGLAGELIAAAGANKDALLGDALKLSSSGAKVSGSGYSEDKLYITAELDGV